MGVNRKDVSKELEQTGGSKDLEKILTTNTIKAKKKPVKKAEPAKEKSYRVEDDWVGKLGRKVREVLHGEKTYISKERAAEMKAQRKAKKLKPKKTKRTTQVESGLKKAGLSDKDLARFK